MKPTLYFRPKCSVCFLLLVCRWQVRCARLQLKSLLLSFSFAFRIIADKFAFACWFLMVAYKDQIKLSTVILQLRKTYRPDSSSTRDAYICISWLASLEVIWIPMCVSIGLSAVICSVFSPCLPTLSPLDSMRNNWFWSMYESGK